MEFRLKRSSQIAAAGLSIALLFTAACHKQESDKEAIRAGIMRHLNGLGSLNMNAMNMNIQSVTVNGDQAHADVEFVPKTGAPAGAGMQVSYNLEKRDGAWVVLKTQAMGGMIQHPPPGQKPPQMQNVHPGGLPNFNDVLNPSGAAPQANAPANGQPGGQDQTPAQKPR